MKKTDLTYKSNLTRNITSRAFTIIAGIFSFIAVLPLILVLMYIIFKGGSLISWDLLVLEPQPPGDDLGSAGGIGNAIVGTFIISGIASVIAVPIGIGGGIYLAEYSKGGSFARFIRFGTNVLSGIPSIIAGVFVYSIIVVTKIFLGSTFSGLAGGIALSIIMLPTVIKTTDEGLKLVPDDLRRGALGLGASMFTTILFITLPSAFRSIATGIVLGLARAAGETAPLIFTALFSYYHITSISDIFYEMSSLSVLIYNFALEPYEAQNELAWAASFVLVILLLGMNLFSRLISKIASNK
ncbi:phosphate ABC transporter permease PstA [Prochlorococcus marinus]|uniref:Phosphate transport system permease protein PstA n=1 Tax=Prochlorococcus marinus (strain MIT 9211) TaxID=93059 RepID=Q0GPK5_PROM4|nr:phosphate ABC transporter permease PstA [Prochlorococcus marinus]ABI23492.1 putative phosphate ABC transporter [Prochlorococcus marinus str. MIT 9211]ABX08795.1 putative phosphate ABC transporter [Prochlorococcus marinus str. MIT 9211]